MRRGRARRTREAWIVAGLAAAAAALTPALLVALKPAPPRASLAEAPPTAGRAVGPAAPASVPRAPPPPARRAVDLTLQPPYEVADGLTIVSETRRVRLAGLEGPAAEAACFDPAGKLWACGLQARAALYNLIRRETVRCRAEEAAGGAPPIGDCRAGDAPLDRALVLAGFARPAAGSDRFGPEAADAKANGRGLWNGGWRVRP